MGEARGVEAMLQKRPDLEPALETVLAVDRNHATWTYEDIGVDSGTFGELVSWGVVEEIDDEYRLANPERVRAALDGESVGSDRADDAAVSMRAASIRALVDDVERRTVGLLAGCLLVLLFTRAYFVSEICREGTVVLSGNDPYHYRYWVERTTDRAQGIFDLDAVTTLPTDISNGEPLFVAVLSFVAELFGGTPDTVGTVMAWYPVIAALVTGVLVYAIAVEVTADQRVGLTAILVLSLIPGHALRTGIGYADHHAFDYVWVALTFLAVATLVTRRFEGQRPDRQTTAAVLALAVGVTAQILAWEAGPLLLAPVGLIVFGRSWQDLVANRSPLRSNAPIVAGIGLGTVGVVIGAAVFGWHRLIVVASVLVLFAGSVAVVAAAEAIRLRDGDPNLLPVLGVGGSVVGVGAIALLMPSLWGQFRGRLNVLFGKTGIAEVVGLFSPDSLGFLLLFGLTLVAAVPVFVLALSRARLGNRRWLVLGVYGWYFLALASVQVRFVGELAIAGAIGGAVGLVWLANWISVARPLDWSGQVRRRATIPDRSNVFALVAIFLLFSGFGLVQVSVKNSQITVSEETYQTATAIEAHATEHGTAYPENYVLSSWGRNRVYNYFVNGHSDSFRYARVSYSQFLSRTEPDEAYEEYDHKVGYVVTTDRPTTDTETAQYRLHERNGLGSATRSPLVHYQLVTARADGSTKAFALVEGATIEGDFDANESVRLETTVTVEGQTLSYNRTRRTTPNGEFRTGVAYPGTYRVTVDGMPYEVMVTQRDVLEGRSVIVDEE